MNSQNPIPGIETYQENANPVLASPNSSYTISFYQTRDTLMDIDTYRNFLKNCEARFRHSVTYNNYKAHLIDIGLNRCQVHGYITSDMEGVSLEMHHAILTLFDICLLISEHKLNTIGYVTSFDIVEALKEDDYTAETWAKLKTAYDKAKELNGKDGAVQSEVDAAVADLDAAIKGLVKADGQGDANDDKDEKEGGIPVWVWIVIAAAVGIAAVVIVILVLSKKKKTKIDSEDKE